MGRNPISEYYEKPAFVWEEIGMAKGQRQKLKLLYLKDILLEETDETKGLTLDEIWKCTGTDGKLIIMWCPDSLNWQN